MANTPSHKASIRLLLSPRCPVEATSSCWVPSSNAHSESFQYSPTSPTWENADSASATVLGRQSGASRSPYHSCAKLQPCCSERVPPRGRFHCWHQRSTCCSDRNRSMVRQVKDNVFVPVLGRYSDVYDPLTLQESTVHPALRKVAVQRLLRDV